MRTKTFGQTGLEMSVMGMGCMRLPLDNPKDPTAIDEDLVTAMLRLAIDQGLNYIDTAYPYHGNHRHKPGRSEPVVGQALKGGYREKINLATKLPTWLVESKKQMHNYLDEQLKRLDTSYVDFYLLHNINKMVWPKIKDLGVFEFLDEARKDGRIKYPGFSFHDRYPIFEELIESYDWAMAQIQYNYLDVDYQAGRRGAQLARDKNIALVVMEPLRGGFLVNYIPDELQDVLASSRPDWSLAEWGLKWLWSQPEPTMVLSGASTMEQLEENLRIAQSEDFLTDQDLEAIAQVRSFFKDRLKAGCTDCGYCLPCPQGVVIPKNLAYLNSYFITDSDEMRARSKYYFQAQVSPEESFVHCIGCGECEVKCPQNLPISELLTQDAPRIIGAL